MKNNLMIAQSGGPTAAINATLVGILQGICTSGKIETVYGARNGIEGVIKGNLIKLNEIVQEFRTMTMLAHTPSSALGTCRFKLEDWHTNEVPYQKIINVFLQYDIKYFIYIGGNDSMDTVNKLSVYCTEKGYEFIIVGAPKTIDNDLNLTDHSPGFGSAAKYIATTVSELAADIGAYDVPAVTIVEIMGRNAGWLAASAALAKINQGAGPDLIYLCERTLDRKKFLTDVRGQLEQKSGILVAVSEGVRNSKGVYLSEDTSNRITDHFGHGYLSGAGHMMEQVIRREIGCKVRSIELNLMQRSAAHIASETDILEAELVGQKAFYCALAGQTGTMAAIKRISNEPYRIEMISVPVNEVASYEKKVPQEWITPDGCDVTQEMIMYLKPLIQGELNLNYKNGIPVQVKLS